MNILYAPRVNLQNSIKSKVEIRQSKIKNRKLKIVKNRKLNIEN